MMPRTAFPAQDYWPEEMEPQTFYEPTDRGFEAQVAERMEYWNERRKALKQSGERRGLSGGSRNREQATCIRSIKAPIGRRS